MPRGRCVNPPCAPTTSPWLPGACRTLHRRRFSMRSTARAAMASWAPATVRLRRQCNRRPPTSWTGSAWCGAVRSRSTTPSASGWAAPRCRRSSTWTKATVGRSRSMSRASRSPPTFASGAKRSWKSGQGRSEFASVVPVATLSEQEVRKRHGPDGVALQAYLLAHPHVLAEVQQSPLAFATAKLAESLAAYRNGERERAAQLAIQSYLEGFELVEHQLAAVDAGLMTQTERAMMAYRQQVQSGAPLAEVERQATEVQSLLAQARERLGSTALYPRRRSQRRSSSCFARAWRRCSCWLRSSRSPPRSAAERRVATSTSDGSQRWCSAR